MEPVDAKGGVGRRAGHRDDEARRVRDVVGLCYAIDPRGRTVPDERELAALLGTTRQSVRSGLELLRDEGIIERRRGLGTYLATRAPIDVLGASGVGREAEGERVTCTTVQLLECRVPGDLARLFGAAPSDPVLVIERLHRLGERPLSVWDHYVGGSHREPARERLRLGPATDRPEDELAVVGARVSLHLEASLADASVAELLEVNVRQPLLRYERIVRDGGGQVAVIGFGYSRGALNLDSEATAGGETPGLYGVA